MANENPRGTVSIELDKLRLIKLSHNAIIDAEKVLGISLFGSSPLEKGFTAIRAILWAGLRQEDPALTLERTGELLDLITPGEAANKGIDAITAAFGKAEKEDEPKNG